MSSLMVTPIQLRWSDFDANHHLRHSAYYDFGAMARTEMLVSIGLDAQFLQTHFIGPVLFKEECEFRKEVRMSDKMYMHSGMLNCRPNGTRFCFRHVFYKQPEVICATLTIWGDFMNLRTRKLAEVPEILTDKIMEVPRFPEFQFV